jgi:hypothetical protein
MYEPRATPMVWPSSAFTLVTPLRGVSSHTFMPTASKPMSWFSSPRERATMAGVSP